LSKFCLSLEAGFLIHKLAVPNINACLQQLHSYRFDVSCGPFTLKPLLVKRNRRARKQPASRASHETAGPAEVNKPFTLLLTVPFQFVLLCRLLGITPEKMLTEFAEHVAMTTWKNQNSENQRKLLREYISEMKYGCERFSVAELKELLQHLSVFSSINLADAPVSLLEVHETWRDQYLKHWFQYWQSKAVSKH
jgi:hypothetical protein